MRRRRRAPSPWDKNVRFTLTVNNEQLGIIQRATEIFASCLMGELSDDFRRIIVEEILRRSKKDKLTDEQHDKLDEHLQAIERLIDPLKPEGTSFAISDKRADEDAQIAWDISQVTHWWRFGDPPARISKKTPYPELKITDWTWEGSLEVMVKELELMGAGLHPGEKQASEQAREAILKAAEAVKRCFKAAKKSETTE